MENQQTKSNNNRIATIGLCLGVASIFLFEFSIFPILAVVLGIIALTRKQTKWKAITGITLGIIFLLVRISLGHIDRIIPGQMNNLQETSTEQATTASFTPSNPDYVKNPSGYLVDFDNKITSRIPINRAMWVEKIIDSALIKVSYTETKANQNIIVFKNILIPGVSYSTRFSENTCREKASVEFLNSNLLKKEVYLANETAGEYRLLMAAPDGKNTTDVAEYIIKNGYGATPFHEPNYGSAVLQNDGFFMYPGFQMGMLTGYAQKLQEDFEVARLAKRGFWGLCK